MKDQHALNLTIAKAQQHRRVKVYDPTRPRVLLKAPQAYRPIAL